MERHCELKIHSLLTGSLIRAGHIQRYSSVQVHHSESVAEHSFYVALYSMLLGRHFRLPSETMEQLMQAAILHDIDECLTGDFTRSFKHSSEDIERALHKGATRAVWRVIEEVAGEDEAALLRLRWETAKHQATIPGRIVKFADYLSVAAFLFREAALGNLYAVAMLNSNFVEYTDSFVGKVWSDYEPWLQEIREIVKSEGWRKIHVAI